MQSIGQSTPRPWTIGTRGSELALWQSRWVQSRLASGTVLEVIQTSGDRIQSVDLSTVGAGKGFFTKEIDEALVGGRVDLAVHSLKDLPTRPPEGIADAAVTERVSVADLLIVRPDAHDPTSDLPVRPGTVVGASSLRRQALVRVAAPHAIPGSLRGNVPTRVARLREGRVGAIVLAEAGLSRLALDLSGLHVYRLDPTRWLPAAGQGALGVQVRAGDAESLALVTPLHHATTAAACGAERGLLQLLEGGCHLPLGVWARVIDGRWRLDAVLADSEGKDVRLRRVRVQADDPATLAPQAFALLSEARRAGLSDPWCGGDLCVPVQPWW